MRGMNGIELAQDRDQVAGCCKCSNEPPGSIECGEFIE